MSEKMFLSILNDLNGSSSGIVAAALISNDGLAVAHVLQRNGDPDRVGGMSAAMLALARRAVREMDLGNFTRATIEADEGMLFVMQAGSEAMLVTLARNPVNLGMARRDIEKAVARIAAVGDFVSEN